MICKEVIILTIISRLAFLTFLVTLILGFTKKNKKLKLTALFVFFAFIGLAGFKGYKIASKTYDKIADTFKMRTGDEIYDALFDKRKTDCIKILNYQDQVVPKIDYPFGFTLKLAQKNSNGFYQNIILMERNFRLTNGTEKYRSEKH